MALALTWNSRADLDLKFDEFFNSEHTISAWFMPHFPDSYAGSIIGEASSPATQAFFMVGTGPWHKVPEDTSLSSSRMFLRIGIVEQPYDHHLKARVWHHLALVRKNSTFTLYVNGEALDPPIVNPVQAPAGVRLRLGQTAQWSSVSQKRRDQFYGLIDDVAVFTKAFTAAQISELKKPATKLDANDSNLLAGFPLATPKTAQKKFDRAVTLLGTAAITNTSTNRDNRVDAKALPLPVPAFQFTLPVSLHQALYVGQSPFDEDGSHYGSANFIYDLSPIAVQPTGNPALKNGKRPVLPGIPFHALTDGEIAFAVGDKPPGKSTGGNVVFIAIEGMPGYYWKHAHWKAGTLKFEVGDKVKAGDAIAEIADTGVTEGNIHLHTGIVYFPDGEVPPDGNGKHTVTVPFAFTGFFQLDRDTNASGAVKDTWDEVNLSIPRTGRIIANSPPFVLMDPNKKPLAKDVGDVSAKRLTAIRAMLARPHTFTTLRD